MARAPFNASEPPPPPGRSFLATKPPARNLLCKYLTASARCCCCPVQWGGSLLPATTMVRMCVCVCKRTTYSYGTGKRATPDSLLSVLCHAESSRGRRTWEPEEISRASERSRSSMRKKNESIRAILSKSTGRLLLSCYYSAFIMRYHEGRDIVYWFALYVHVQVG